MTTVLKLGGSVVTEKDEPETVDHAMLDRVVAAIATYGDDLVVVHGGGSFGHHHADRYGVSTTDGTTDATAVAAIHAAMTDLGDAVVGTFHDHGVDAVPVSPFSVASREADGTLSLPATQVETMLEEGFLPVLHGDCVAHEGKGATILSGDDVVVSLAETLGADRVGLCSTVPGVLDADGAVVPEIEDYDEVSEILGGSDATDVTGGMAGKVQTLLSLSVPAAIFDADGLPVFLRGDRTGTVIRGG